MPTAIVWVHTTEGLVIGSDGRVSEKGEVFTDEAQKLFFIPGNNVVYGTGGTSMFTTGSRSGVIDVDESLDARARAIRLDPRMLNDISRYGRSLCADLYSRIKKAKNDGILDEPFEEHFTAHGYAGFVVTHVYIWGYRFVGPKQADVVLMHEKQVPSLQVLPMDVNRTWNVYGSIAVYDALREPTHPTFAQFGKYRIPAMAKNYQIGMEEGIEIAKNYILACQTSEALALDPQACQGIGGKPQILTFRPQGEPQWVDGYRPVEPQAWRVEFRARYIKVML